MIVIYSSVRVKDNKTVESQIQVPYDVYPTKYHT